MMLLIIGLVNIGLALVLDKKDVGVWTHRSNWIIGVSCTMLGVIKLVGGAK